MHALAQVAPPGVLHEGDEAGLVERDSPRSLRGCRTLFSRLASGLGSELEEAPRQPDDLSGVAQREGPRLGGIEDVILELRGQIGELGLNLVESLA